MKLNDLRPIELLSINKLYLNTDNPRHISEGKLNDLIDSVLIFPKMLISRPIIINTLCVILGGNMRYKALVSISKLTEKELKNKIQKTQGYNKLSSENKEDLLCYWFNWLKHPRVPTMKVDFTPEQEREFTIKDNVAYGEWDLDILKNWDTDHLSEFGLDVGELWKDESESDKKNIYTTKVESPIYEPKGERPLLNELADDTKTNELIAKIKKAKIPKEEQTFLIKAAQRHIVFDYQNIAEYYAHAIKEVQQLMEDSALVIIDYNKAIEDGFVKLIGDLQNLNYNGNEDDE